MNEVKISDEKILVDALVKELRELKAIVDTKTRDARDLSQELDRLSREHDNTSRALRKVLKPLVEENATVYLTHEDNTVRSMAKETLLNRHDGEMAEKAYATSSIGRLKGY